MQSSTRKWRYLRKLFRRSRARLDGMLAKLVQYDADALCRESVAWRPSRASRPDIWRSIDAPTRWLVAERVILESRRVTWLDRLRADLWLEA